MEENSLTSAAAPNTHNPHSCSEFDIWADPLDLKGPWSSLFYVGGMTYMFLAVHLVCDHYFVHAVEKIGRACNLADDVAGATLMAAGTSAPELVSGLIGVFVAGAGDVGVGTVVGSLVFNSLVITGLCIIVAPNPAGLAIGCISTTRDVFAFSVAILILTLCFADGKITQAESCMMVGAYLLHLFVCFNLERICSAVTGNDSWYKDHDRTSDEENSSDNGSIELSNIPADTSGSSAATATTTTTSSSSVWEKGLCPATGKEYWYNSETDESTYDDPTKEAPVQTTVDMNVGSKPGRPTSTSELQGDISENRSLLAQCIASCGTVPSHNHLSHASNALGVIYYLLCAPILWAFAWSIPNCSRAKWRNWYPLTLFNSVAWLALLIFLMIAWAQKAGCLLGISDAVMGLTFCAAGTSAPDCLASIIVAREGKSKMAVSNIFGSNTFDVLLALGLPWMVHYCASNEVVVVDSKNIVPNAIILVLLVFFFVACISSSAIGSGAGGGFRPMLPRWSGALHLSLYACYLIFVIVWAA